jgi:hypothetical protein
VRLLVGVLATDDVSVAVVDQGAVAAGPTRTPAEERQRCDGADDADDQKDHSDRVEVEPMLVRAHRHSEVENCSDGYDDKAGDKSAGHKAPPMPLFFSPPWSVCALPLIARHETPLRFAGAPSHVSTPAHRIFRTCALDIRFEIAKAGYHVTERNTRLSRSEYTVGIILLVLLLALLFGGLGFAVHALWIVAVIVFVAWLVGFGLARGEGSGGRARWYRW